MQLSFECKGLGRFYVAWKLFFAAARVLAAGDVVLDLRDGSAKPPAP